MRLKSIGIFLFNLETHTQKKVQIRLFIPFEL